MITTRDKVEQRVSSKRGRLEEGSQPETRIPGTGPAGAESSRAQGSPPFWANHAGLTPAEEPYPRGASLSRQD